MTLISSLNRQTFCSTKRMTKRDFDFFFPEIELGLGRRVHWCRKTFPIQTGAHLPTSQGAVELSEQRQPGSLSCPPILFVKLLSPVWLLFFSLLLTISIKSLILQFSFHPKKILLGAHDSIVLTIGFSTLPVPPSALPFFWLCGICFFPRLYLPLWAHSSLSPGPWGRSREWMRRDSKDRKMNGLMIESPVVSWLHQCFDLWLTQNLLPWFRTCYSLNWVVWKLCKPHLPTV